MRTMTLCVLMLLAGMLGSAGAFAAESYPAKAVRVVVPFPPGGAADIVARQVTTRLATVLGQQIIVDNRGGAGGMIGAENAARSAPDGYNLLFASSSVLSINPHLGAKASYDVLKSFTPISLIGNAPNVLTVHPSVPAKTVKQLIALAKAKPDSLAYASNGAGTLSHLTGELFSERAGIKMLHVPVQGRGARGDRYDGRQRLGAVRRIPQRVRASSVGPAESTGGHQRQTHRHRAEFADGGGNAAGIRIQPVVGAVRSGRPPGGYRRKTQCRHQQGAGHGRHQEKSFGLWRGAVRRHSGRTGRVPQSRLREMGQGDCEGGDQGRALNEIRSINRG